MRLGELKPHTEQAKQRALELQMALHPQLARVEHYPEDMVEKLGRVERAMNQLNDALNDFHYHVCWHQLRGG